MDNAKKLIEQVVATSEDKMDNAKKLIEQVVAGADPVELIEGTSENDWMFLTNEAMRLSAKAYAKGELWSKHQIYPKKYYSELERKAKEIHGSRLLQGSSRWHELAAFDDLFNFYLRAQEDPEYAKHALKVVASIRSRRHLM